QNLLALTATPIQWGSGPSGPLTTREPGATLDLWSVETLKTRQQLLGEDDVWVFQLAFSPDGKRLVSLGTEQMPYDVPRPRRPGTSAHLSLAKAAEMIVW